MKKMKMNVPNQLTMLRMIMIPAFVACLLYIEEPLVCGLVTALVFGLTAFTDMLDGKIARKYNLVTDFGKFMDSVADKLMVFSALLTLTAKFGVYSNLSIVSFEKPVDISLINGVETEIVFETVYDTNLFATIMFNVLLWTSIIVFLRELGVTSIRLVCAKTDVGVIPANFFGKAKTVVQVVAIAVILIEFAVNESTITGAFTTYYIGSFICILAMLVMTIGSGINYIKIYGKHINPNK